MPKQDVAVEMFYDGVWNDLTAADDVLAEEVITIRRGQGDESAAPRPALMSFRLDNRDDRFRTSNPESPLYGKVGRNTPVRVKVGASVRGAAETSSMSPDQTDDFRESPLRGKAWSDVQAGGLLQRINQWTEPLHSTFYTYNTEEISGLAGYWALEDGRGTVLAASAVPGAVNEVLIGTAFDSQARPPGSAPVADVVMQGTAVTSRFIFAGGNAGNTNGWQFSIMVFMPSLENGLFQPIRLTMLDGSTVSVLLDDSTSQISLVAFDANSVSRFTTTAGWGSYNWSGRWIMLVANADQSGGTTTVRFSYRAAEDPSWLQISGTYVGNTSNLYRHVGFGVPANSTVGHVIGTHGMTDDLMAEARFTAMRGYPGERTGFRVSRLLTRVGITHFIRGDFNIGQQMGPQPVDTLANLLAECVRTEDGLLFDEVGSLALIFVQRNYRYNQTPKVVLTAQDFKSLPREVVDDLNVHNVVTVAQRGGGDFTVQDTTSSMGSAPPPVGVGEYVQTVDVNVLHPEADLEQWAWWWLHRGTVDLPRFTTVTVDLGARPAIASDAQSVDIGDVIEITGVRENTIRLFVVGLVERIGNWSRTISWTCAPDQQFNVGEYDDGVARYDSASTTLKAGVNSTATAVTFRTANVGDLWSTVDEPYDVFIAGERVRVTTMNAAALVGGQWDQTATVQRSRNGIVKSLSAGEPIHIEHPGRWVLP